MAYPPSKQEAIHLTFSVGCTVQRAITDLAFNSGPYFLSRDPGNPRRELWEDFVDGHFEAAAEELAALSGDRFDDDAADIEGAINNGSVPGDARNGVCSG